MTCNHAKINHSDWSNSETVDAATQELNFFQLQCFVERRRLPTLISVKTCSQFDA